LRHGLLGHGAQGRLVVGFAGSKAEAHHRRQVKIHGELRRAENTLPVDVDNLGAARDGVGPFDVQVGFHHVPVVARVVAHQVLYGIVVRQIKNLPEGAEVGEVERGIADDGDVLAVAIDVGRVEGGDVVDGGQIVGHQGVSALTRSVQGANDLRGRLEIVEADESADYLRQRGGNGGCIDVGEMGFAIHQVVMEAGAEGAGGLLGGAAERDPVAAAGDVVDL